MSVLLTTVGTLALSVSLVGIAIGVFMATDPRTRHAGWLFAIWWVTGIAVAGGFFMRDLVTVALGALFFLVAGGALVLAGGGMGKTATKRRGQPAGRSARKTSRRDRTEYRKAAS